MTFNMEYLKNNHQKMTGRTRAYIYTWDQIFKSGKASLRSPASQFLRMLCR